MHILHLLILDERFELGSTRYGQVESLGSEERLDVKQVEIVFVHKVSEKLACQAVQCGHLGQSQLPLPIRCTSYMSVNTHLLELSV